VYSWISNIQYPASSICPENASHTSFPACPVEKILCNVGLIPNPDVAEPKEKLITKARKFENTKKKEN